MARIRIAYIGGGSTRAPGTLASIVTRGSQFAGSEVVLVDLDEERMAIVKQLTERMAAAHGVDLRVSMTTDRREALGVPTSSCRASVPAVSRPAISTKASPRDTACLGRKHRARAGSSWRCGRSR